MHTVLIIGAGLSGLAASIFFQKMGLKCLVFEKAPRTAPLIRGFRKNGLTFETGFHYAGGLGRDGILKNYLEHLGVWPYLKAESLPGPGGETLRFAGTRDIQVPDRFEVFRALFPVHKDIDTFFQASYDEFRRSAFLNESLRSGPLEVHDRSGLSLARALSPLNLPPQLKTLISFRCLLYGLKPSESSFSDFSMVNVPYLNGAHSFEGGGEALAKAFEEAARDCGAVIKNGWEVTAIETAGANLFKGLRAIDSEGREEKWAGDYCLFSGNPASLPGLLPDKALRPVLAKRLSKLKQTPAPFLLFASTGSPLLAGRQLFLLGQDDIEDCFSPDGGSVYISGGPGHDGRWPLTIATFMAEESTLDWRGSRFGRRPREYQAYKAQKAETLQKYLLAHCPELNGDLRLHGSATDLTLSHYSFGSSGGIYGKLHSLNEAPVLPLVRVRNLALAGQNIVLPGLLGVLVSSALAAGCLLGFDEVWEVLR